MDTPIYEPKVLDTFPDSLNNDEVNPFAVPSRRHERKGSLSGAFNYARARPFHLPRHVAESYPVFEGKQECALRIALHDLAREITKSTGMTRLDMHKEKLTIHLHSQSKLSQQELGDLQKATHFDKKELQQWYKGRDQPATGRVMA